MRVEVAAEGFLDELLYLPAGKEDAEIELVRAGSLSGRVVARPDGVPVRAFRLQLHRSLGDDWNPVDPSLLAGERAAFEFQSEDGSFAIPAVEPGLWDLGLTAPGFAGALYEGVAVGPGEAVGGLLIETGAEAAVRGVVADARSGAPIERALVLAYPPNPEGQYREMVRGRSRNAVSDAGGRFALGGLSGGTLKLVLRHTDYVEESVLVDLAAGAPLDLGTLRLRTGAGLHGQVFDQREVPLPGAVVSLSDLLGNHVRSTASDGDGSYRLGGVGPGTYRLQADRARSDGLPDAAVTTAGDSFYTTVVLEGGEDLRVDLRPAPRGEAAVEGLVAWREEAAAGAWVSLLPERAGSPLGAECDPDGNYRIEGVPQGSYLVHVGRGAPGTRGAGLHPSGLVGGVVDVPAAGTVVHDVVIPDGIVRGNVIGAGDGLALVGVRVRLLRTDEGRPAFDLLQRSGDKIAELFTNENGEFFFSNLAPGTYSLVAGGVTAVGAGNPRIAVRELTELVLSGPTAVLDLRVELYRGGGIDGTVVDAEGRPVGGASVWARGAGGGWLSRLSETVTDQTGRFRLSALEPGPWTLVVGSPRHALLTVRGIPVEAEAWTPWEFRLGAGTQLVLDCGSFTPAELELDLIGPQGPLPLTLASLEDVLGPGPASAGVLHLGRFQPGPYRLRVRAGGELVHDADVSLEAGADMTTVSLAN